MRRQRRYTSPRLLAIDEVGYLSYDARYAVHSHDSIGGKLPPNSMLQARRWAHEYCDRRVCGERVGLIWLFGQIGLVTLGGLITKHGILIVEFTNQLREQGKPLQEALIEAAVLRLRPILMTTGAMVLGAVPLALARGAGAESRSQIGWVIVGGMLLGTLLTLFVVPTVYSYLARRERVSAGKAVPQPAAGA